MDKLKLNDKYITKNENIIGMGLFIGDYIPIQSISIDKIPLTLKSELNEIFMEEGDISYVNIENDLEDYNKFEYTNLYYTQFINSILHIIQNIDNKKNINRLIQNTDDEDDIEKLIENLKKDLSDYINKKDYIVKEFQKTRLNFVEPNGGFYIFPSLKNYKIDIVLIIHFDGTVLYCHNNININFIE